MNRLTDRQLVTRLVSLVGKERSLKVNVVKHLGEIESRSAHLSLGYGSLFEFATKHLGYSEGAASRRIRVARCLRKHPGALGLLQRNEANLSTIALVSEILDEENRESVLRAIRHRSQREVRAIVARYSLPRDVPDRMRPVVVRVNGAVAKAKPSRATTLFETDADARQHEIRPSATTKGEDRPEAHGETFATGADSSPHASHSPAGSRPGISFAGDLAGLPVGSPDRHATGRQDTRSADTEPAERYEQRVKIQFAARPGFVEKFERVRSLLSGRFPRGSSFEQTFEAVLDAFLERKCPRRRRKRREQRRRNQQEKTARPSKRRTHLGEGRGGQSSRSRHVPAAVRDEVFVRDGGQCSYVAPSGRRCGSTHNLQIDHVKPFGRGGMSSPENLRLLCARHNQLEADRIYGKEKMSRWRGTKERGKAGANGTERDRGP